MTIDERITALSEFLNLLANMQRDNEMRFVQIMRNFELVHDSIKRLENIAVAHE
jgi:hypothetical protein